MSQIILASASPRRKELLEQIKKKGNIAHVTLHVGLGTFRPVKVDDVRKTSHAF